MAYVYELSVYSHQNIQLQLTNISAKPQNIHFIQFWCGTKIFVISIFTKHHMSKSMWTFDDHTILITFTKALKIIFSWVHINSALYVISTQFTWFGCKCPRIKACTLRSFSLFHHFKSLLLVVNPLYSLGCQLWHRYSCLIRCVFHLANSCELFFAQRIIFKEYATAVSPSLPDLLVFLSLPVHYFLNQIVDLATATVVSGGSASQAVK